MQKKSLSDKNLGFLLVGLSGFLSGFIVFSGHFFLNLGLSLFEISTIPFVFSLFFLAPFVFRKNVFPKKKDFLILFFYGLVAAGTIFCQFAGVVFGGGLILIANYLVVTRG